MDFGGSASGGGGALSSVATSAVAGALDDAGLDRPQPTTKNASTTHRLKNIAFVDIALPPLKDFLRLLLLLRVLRRFCRLPLRRLLLLLLLFAYLLPTGLDALL